MLPGPLLKPLGFSPFPGERPGDLLGLLWKGAQNQPLPEPSFEGAADFAAHYRQHLHPQVAEFERRRLDSLEKLRNRMTLGLMLLIIALPLQVVVHLALLHSEANETIGLLCLLVYGAVLAWMWQPIHDYKSAVKADIFPHIFSFFGPDFTYSEAGRLPMEMLQPAGIIPPHDFALIEDYVRGNYKNVVLETQEVKLQQKRGYGKTRRIVTVFQGMAVRLNMNKRFHGHTTVKEDQGAIANWFTEKFTWSKLEKVTLEDPGFEARFEVYSSDQIEARYLLTPGFMERLHALSTLYGGMGLQAAFYEDHLLLLIPSAIDRFAASSLFLPATFGEDIQRVLAEMKEIFAMVELLKLYEQTRL